MFAYAGEIAAFGAAMCWTIGSQMTEAAGHRIGAMAVNALRLVLALFFLLAWGAIVTGSALPQGFSAEQVAWLAGSGFVGLFLGDLCLFAAFVEIGPRLTMLIMCLHVPMTALLGWAMLGEPYERRQWAGMLVTLAGVAWVVRERPAAHLTTRMIQTPHPRRVRAITTRGLTLALGGAVGQAVGMVMSKKGLGPETDAFAATLIRFAAAIVGFIPLLSFMGYWPRIGRAARNGRAMMFVAGAAFIGSALGVALSLVAIGPGGTTTGVAATIIATVPILLIPFAIVIHKEHVSRRAALGAVIAFLGVALLVWGQR